MTTKGRFGGVLAVLILASALSGISAGAGSTYLSGTPDLVAAINGTNEFSPGSEQNIVIHVRNTGVDDIKIVQPGGGASGDPPSTARMVTLTLLPGDAPVEIKTNSQMIGDIASGKSALATFSVHVEKDAGGGTYLLPLLVNYTYLAAEDRVGGESVIFIYDTET
ncbi:MAG: S-layer protein, partial [Methanoregulaceae archaeon]|nr:S-layer protein [Methanoregulaceae archaeon]